MSPDVDTRFAERRSSNAEAQRLYLIAKSHAAKLDGPSNEEAIALYRKSLEADPTFALAKVWLAQAISNQRYFTSQTIEQLSPDIEPLLADVERSSPELVDLYLVRGTYRILMRDREAALRDLRRALEINPSSKGAASILGYYYLTAVAPRDALMYYTMASALDPRDFGMYAYQCIALTDLGRFAAADVACARARALEPESPWVFSVSSSLEAARGNFEQALKWSDAALERGGDVAWIRGERGRWLVTLGLLSDAGTAYREAVRADAVAARRNSDLAFVGGSAAIEAGGAAGLRAFIADNQLDRSADPPMQFVLASMLLIVGDHDVARDLVNRALASPQLAPEDLASPWQAKAGWSYLLITAAALRATGDTAQADRRLEECSHCWTAWKKRARTRPDCRSCVPNLRPCVETATPQCRHCGALPNSDGARRG